MFILPIYFVFRKQHSLQGHGTVTTDDPDNTNISCHERLFRLSKTTFPSMPRKNDDGYKSDSVKVVEDIPNHGKRATKSEQREQPDGANAGNFAMWITEVNIIHSALNAEKL